MAIKNINAEKIQGTFDELNVSGDTTINGGTNITRITDGVVTPVLKVLQSGSSNWEPVLKIVSTDGINPEFGVQFVAYNETGNKVMRLDTVNGAAFALPAGITLSNPNLSGYMTAGYWQDFNFRQLNTNANQGYKFYSYNFDSSYATPTVSMLNNGNLGVGTGTPTANLQVDQYTKGEGTVASVGNSTTVTGNDTHFTNTFKVGDTITITGQSVRTISTIVSDTELVLTSPLNGTVLTTQSYTLVGGTRFSVLGNGNVGIGVSNPTEKLEVDGDIDATGYKVGGVTGFTGTGAYTNFEIVGGIIVNAT